MLSNLTEDVIFALIRYEGGKVLAYHTVPVWGIVFVEVGLDVLSDSLLLVSVVHDFIYLSDESFLHVLADLLDNPANVSLSGSHFFLFSRLMILLLLKININRDHFKFIAIQTILSQSPTGFVVNLWRLCGFVEIL